MSVSLRRAVAADVPALAAVFVAAWRAGYGGVVAPEVLDRLDVAEVAGWLGPLVEETTLTTTVAVVGGGSVVGFARYGADPDRPAADAGFLAALYVDPTASGHGIGRRLLSHAVASLGSGGRPDVRLWVFEANARARRLYERAGFRLDGHRMVDPQWGVPQVGYRRRPVNTAVPLPPLPEVRLDPVVDLAFEPVRRPLREPFRTALREIRSLAGWRVTLTTASGATASATTVATPEVTGDTDESITAAFAGPLRAAVAAGGELTEVLGAVAAAGAGTPSAAAAVDMAVHGLAASALGVPVAGAHLAGLACVTERSPYPVMADESVFTAADARRVADARAADLVNLKLLKCGGLFPARELVAVCAEAGLGLLVGCMLEPAEGIAVAQALASVASAGPLAHDLDAGWWVAPPSS